MKKVTLLSLATAALLASCATSTENLVEENQEVGTLGISASFGISVEEQNGFSTKAITAFTPDATTYSYNVLNEAGDAIVTTLPSTTPSATLPLTGWGAQTAMDLFPGKYQVFVSNEAFNYVCTPATHTPTKGTDFAGVIYASTNSDVFEVTAGNNTDAPIDTEWKMLSSVIDVVAHDAVSATFFSTLYSYSIRIYDATNSLVVWTKADGDLSETAADHQAYFAPSTYSVELTYTATSASTPVTVSKADAIVIAEGVELAVRFKAYNGTITLDVTMPDGTTVPGTDVEFN